MRKLAYSDLAESACAHMSTCQANQALPNKSKCWGPCTEHLCCPANSAELSAVPIAVIGHACHSVAHLDAGQVDVLGVEGSRWEGWHRSAPRLATGSDLQLDEGELQGKANAWRQMLFSSGRLPHRIAGEGSARVVAGPEAEPGQGHHREGPLGLRVMHRSCIEMSRPDVLA